MASKDVKPQVSSGRSRGHYGGSRTRWYSDGGRGDSKSAWERFYAAFTGAEDKKAFLLEMPDEECYSYMRASVIRHQLIDIAIMPEPGYEMFQDKIATDSRAHRLVKKAFDEAMWLKFHLHLVEGYNNILAIRKQLEQERAKKWEGERAALIAQDKAERIVTNREDVAQISHNIDLSLGQFQSDLFQTFHAVEKEGRDGDWLEDPVEAMHGDNGWGYTTQKAKGVKLQVTLSLDLSNSMHYNGVSAKAAHTFRDLGFLLKALQAEYREDLHAAFFTFSEDGWYDREHGKTVTRLTVPEDYQSAEEDANNPFGEFGDFRPSEVAKMEARNLDGMFTGTDTWLYPLFEAIEKWENESSDPGSVRLDIVLTDAVIEHKVDIQRSDVVQERRDGTLSTVFLNFLDEEEWVKSTLPRRSYQIGVTVDTVSAILRNILAEFVAANI